MSKYLADLCKKIGKDSYLSSPIRLEHGTGTGFFGVGNTGSTDCIKERFRGVTDNLGQRWSCWQEIEFVSASCVGITSANFRTTHRVEHTKEVIDLFKEFEQEYIIGGKPFTPNLLGAYIIEHQVVCLIEQTEQKNAGNYDEEHPFSKYSSKIFYKGTDISGYTHAQLQELNKQRFAHILKELEVFDFSGLVQKHTNDLLLTVKKHTLPPIKIAERFHNNEFELLHQHYRHKLNKRTNPLDKKWYSEADTKRYNEWKKANEKI